MNNISELREALADLAKSIAAADTRLEYARRRAKANHRRAKTARKQQAAAQQKADALRAEATRYLSYDDDQNVGKGERLLKKAQRKDKKAVRLASVADKNSARAQHYVGVIKGLLAKTEGFKKRQDGLQDELKKLSGVVHFEIDRNRATGGTERERLKATALLSARRCAQGKRANFYSQAGSYTVDAVFTGESYGERSDCSQWFASVYHACGLDDPNGANWTGGYTGTLVATGRQVSEPKPGDAVIYGSGTGHHVEMYVGPGSKTIGHGSAEINEGTIDVFGDGDYRFFSFV